MEASDAAAIEQVLGGNPEGFRMLVDRHARSLFRIAYRITRNESDADDVVQEAFLRAYRSLDTWDSRATFSTWLHRIAVNAALDLIRRRRRESQMPLDEVLVEPAAPDDDPDLRIGVSAAVAKGMRELSGNERTAFVLRHYEGMSIDEIGAILGTEPSATKHTVFRAVKKLRQVLQPLVRGQS